MSEQGRLIINARGESAKAIAHDGKVTLQVGALRDRVTDLEGVAIVTNEVVFTKQEVAALALQLLDAAGYAAEMQVLPPAVRRGMAVDVQPLRRTRKVGEVSL